VSSAGLEVEVQGTNGALALEVRLAAERTPLVVAGPNGAGKTTLLLMILGALRPRAGRVALGGVTLFDAAAGIDAPTEERRIGFVPQNYALFPHLSVLENVAYGLGHLRRRDRRDRARAALDAAGLASLAARRPHQISGGEAQQVALARALAAAPRALLLDEPLAALDVALRAAVRRRLAEHLASLDLPTVVVTHDRADADALGGDVAVMEAGAVVQRGPLPELAARPATDFVRRFAGSELGTARPTP
jgi:molybdate transport system ATP-binding protein